MIAQKQESSVQFRRLSDALFSPADVWPLVAILATFLLREAGGSTMQPRNARSERLRAIARPLRRCVMLSGHCARDFPEISCLDALVVYSDKHFI
jgi:hypothetical protein